MNPDAPDSTLNRAGRRLEAKRTRKLAALGSGLVLATSAAATAGLVVTATPAGANTIVVDNLNDAGSGSLRQAIADAGEGDTIDLTGLSGTITLTTGSLQINDNLTIVGPGSGRLTISGNHAGRIFTMYQSIKDAGTVTISGLTLTDGDASKESDSAGGAIYFRCDEKNDVVNNLTIDDLVVTGNTATDLGGGLYFDQCNPDGFTAGNLTITSSVFSHNTSTDRGAGAVWADEGNFLSMTDTTIADNTATVSEAGGVEFYMHGGAQILASTVSGNTSPSDAGGLYGYSSGSIVVANSTVTGNSAGGDGGGMKFSGRDSTVSILQTTVAGNTAAGAGDGIVFGNVHDAGADAEGRHQHEGVHTEGGEPATVTITGSIVAANADGTDDIASGDPVTVDLAASVVGTVSPPATIADHGGNFVGVTDPGLSPLADNGGPTQTMALLPTSIAIDAGPDPVPDFPGNDTDQRGAGYPRVVNGKVDVGAFEVQPVQIQPTFTG